MLSSICSLSQLLALFVLGAAFNIDYSGCVTSYQYRPLSLLVSAWNEDPFQNFGPRLNKFVSKMQQNIDQDAMNIPPPLLAHTWYCLKGGENQHQFQHSLICFCGSLPADAVISPVPACFGPLAPPPPPPPPLPPPPPPASPPALLRQSANAGREERSGLVSCQRFQRSSKSDSDDSLLKTSLQDWKVAKKEKVIHHLDNRTHIRGARRDVTGWSVRRRMVQRKGRLEKK